MHSSTGSSHQNTEHVRAFFNQWHIYRKVLELNYLNHREAYAALAQRLSQLTSPFSFLDLGAGDAECITRILQNLPITHYEAVDLSEIALHFAQKNATVISCPSRFIQNDFSQYVHESTDFFDIVFISLSWHHLPSEHKRKFLSELRTRLSPGGSFLCYETIRKSEESREAYLARWWECVEVKWTGFTSEELTQMRAHVFESDYPESLSGYEAIMYAAGFHSFEVLYVDPQNFQAVMAAR